MDPDILTFLIASKMYSECKSEINHHHGELTVTTTSNKQARMKTRRPGQPKCPPVSL